MPHQEGKPSQTAPRSRLRRFLYACFEEPVLEYGWAMAIRFPDILIDPLAGPCCDLVNVHMQEPFVCLEMGCIEHRLCERLNVGWEDPNSVALSSRPIAQEVSKGVKTMDRLTLSAYLNTLSATSRVSVALNRANSVFTFALDLRAVVRGNALVQGSS